MVSPGPGGHPALAPVSLGPLLVLEAPTCVGGEGAPAGRRHRAEQPQVKDLLGAHMTRCALSPINVYPERGPQGYRQSPAPALSGSQSPLGGAPGQGHCGAGHWPSVLISTSKSLCDIVIPMLPTQDRAAYWALAGRPGGPLGGLPGALQTLSWAACPCPADGGREPFVLAGQGGCQPLRSSSVDLGLGQGWAEPLQPRLQGGQQQWRVWPPSASRGRGGPPGHTAAQLSTRPPGSGPSPPHSPRS